LANDVLSRSAAEIVALFRSKQVSPVEFLTATLDRVDRLNGSHNAFVVIDRQGALSDARASEERWRRGKPCGLQAAWGRWMADHAKMILTTEAGGKTKRITAGGVSDAKNDIILYSFVEAESHEAAAKAFEDHPHLQIPQSSIEVMYVRPMGPA
jgi:hypothetical protein